jgi:4-hydroxybenzoate polyprenyltransferase
VNKNKLKRKPSLKHDLALRVARFFYRNTPWLFTSVVDLLAKFVAKSTLHRLSDYSQLMRIEKPIGFFLLLWPTLWALFLASNKAPDLTILIVFIIGTFLMRSAGCVINDFADRNFDQHVARTKLRPLARKSISSEEAIALFVVLLTLAFILVLFLNRFTIGLSFIAVAIAFAYPFMKRHTYFPQLILGAAFAWSIPMAYAAVNNTIALEAWILYISTLLWVLAYDTFYGMVDRKDDIKIGIKSTAILFGDADLSIIAIIQALFMFGMLLVGQRYQLDWPYYFSWFVAIALIGYQFWIARKRQPEQCFKAFLNNNYVGLVFFIGIIFA